MQQEDNNTTYINLSPTPSRVLLSMRSNTDYSIMTNEMIYSEQRIFEVVEPRTVINSFCPSAQSYQCVYDKSKPDDIGHWLYNRLCCNRLRTQNENSYGINSHCNAISSDSNSNAAFRSELVLNLRRIDEVDELLCDGELLTQDIKFNPNTESSKPGPKRQRKSLRKATKWKNGGKGSGTSYACAVCGRTFGFKTNLLTHMRIHTGERPFKCSQCSYSAAHKCNLVTHMNIHTGAKPHKCEYCHQEFRARPNLIVHLRQHTRDLPFKCDKCECSFASQGAMKGHVLRHHGGKTFQCPICEKKFRQQAHLNTHIGRHDQTEPPINQNLANPNGSFPCEVCNEEFSTNRDRRRHLLVHTLAKTLDCVHCGASFQTSDELEIHVLVHFT